MIGRHHGLIDWDMNHRLCKSQDPLQRFFLPVDAIAFSNSCDFMIVFLLVRTLFWAHTKRKYFAYDIRGIFIYIRHFLVRLHRALFCIYKQLSSLAFCASSWNNVINDDVIKSKLFEIYIF